MRDTNFDLEEKIKIRVESLRIRLEDSFIDFDGLRSGFVSKTQFERILDERLNNLLTGDELNHLSAKYDTKDNRSVNYRLFCNTINKKFPENDFRVDPSKKVYKNPEYLGTLRSMRVLDESEEHQLAKLLDDLNEYYSKRNIDILTSFRDFDRNKNGLVTENQFMRCMVEPKLSEKELSILIKKYQQPDQKGTVNYLNFYNDVRSAEPRKSGDMSQFVGMVPLKREETGLSIQEIVDKISVACHKEGIRITDYFRDYDRLRSGIITDRQFATGLTDGVQRQANLAQDDINQLVEYYRRSDGRCDYKTFADTIENAFNIPDMEKKPLAHVIRPPKGLLSKTLNGNLTPDEEDSVAQTLDVISEKVRKYKIALFPFFKDFDRSTAYTRNISKIQFGRVLSTLNLMPSDYDYKLLCRKFEDSVSGDVNYPAFCQAVEEDFVSSKIQDVILTPNDEKTIKQTEYPPDISNVDLNELMARIRNHVLSNRLRIKEFFQDMDPLNSGYVSKSQFVRCISSLGLSSLGKFSINRAQTEALCHEYRSLSDSTKVNWKRFEQDVESVFTLNNLEKNPNLKVTSQEKYLMPPAGTMKWDEANENLNSSESFQKILDDLNTIIKQRRLDCWPPFRDFDKLNRGHITIKQFHQCMAKLNLRLSEMDAAVLESKFGNNHGFNYVKFLNILQPAEVEPPKYDQLRKELEVLNSNKVTYESNPFGDVQSVLIKIKDQVYKKRTSIYEWLRDHDKLNSGRIPRETFKRAFDLCNFDLQPTEIDLVANYYNSRKDNGMVEYKDFCREIETAFGSDELEKNPLIESKQHSSQNLVGPNRLTADEEDYATSGVEKIAKRVRAHRMQLFPKFEDFDRVKNGNVSQNQFRRVLNDLDLLSLLTDAEFASLLKMFFIRIGTRDDVNYNAFCDKVYQAGNFEYRKP